MFGFEQLTFISPLPGTMFLRGHPDFSPEHSDRFIWSQ